MNKTITHAHTCGSDLCTPTIILTSPVYYTTDSCNNRKTTCTKPLQLTLYGYFFFDLRSVIFTREDGVSTFPGTKKCKKTQPNNYKYSNMPLEFSKLF